MWKCPWKLLRLPYASLSIWHRWKHDARLLVLFPAFSTLEGGMQRSTIELAGRRKRKTSAHQPHLNSGSNSVPTSWKVIHVVPVIHSIICQDVMRLWLLAAHQWRGIYCPISLLLLPSPPSPIPARRFRCSRLRLSFSLSDSHSSFASALPCLTVLRSVRRRSVILIFLTLRLIRNRHIPHLSARYADVSGRLSTCSASHPTKHHHYSLQPTRAPPHSISLEPRPDPASS
jgi:hypothetical protein